MGGGEITKTSVIIIPTFFEEVSNCFPEWLHHFPFPEAICKTSHFPMLFNAKQNILITAILEGLNLHPLMLV